LYSPEGVTCLALPMPYRLENCKFSPALCHLAGALAWRDPLQIYEKTLLILKLESSKQPTVKIW